VFKRFLLIVGSGIAGYLVGAFGGGYLVSVLTANQHDAPVEAAMTGAFLTGPVTGLLTLVVVFMRIRPRARRPNDGR
jgi:fructose-specific phosphotransferase system IIC component